MSGWPHSGCGEARANGSFNSHRALSQIEDFDPSTWPKCRNSQCKHGRSFWDRYPELSWVLHAIEGAGERAPIKKQFLHYVGKCDRCGRFHVRCITCDDILSAPEDNDNDFGHQCRCKTPWFWLASVEQDEEGNKSAELHAVLGIGEVRTVDRRAY
jgi:hypothetical protein